MPDPVWLQGEYRRLEFQETWPEGDNIVGTAVAFANGAGGRIVFGVRNEPREITSPGPLPDTLAPEELRGFGE